MSLVGPGGKDDDWSAQAFHGGVSTCDCAWWAPVWVVAGPKTATPSLEAVQYTEALFRAHAVSRRVRDSWRAAYAPECVLATSVATTHTARAAIRRALSALNDVGAEAAAGTRPRPAGWPSRRAGHPGPYLAAIAARDGQLFPPARGQTFPGTFHVRVCDVVRTLASVGGVPLDAVAATLEARAGQPNAFVAGYLLWRYALPGVHGFLKPTRADDVPYDKWPAAWKPVTTAIKRYGAPADFPSGAAMLAEAETLVGYGYGEVDWRLEELRRRSPDLATTFSDREVTDALARLYRRALEQAPSRNVDLDEYWGRRWFWLAAGSEAGASATYGQDAFVGAFRALAGRKFRHTHKSAAEARGAGYLRQLLARRPEIRAAASAKVNERGKVRALYAGDPASYYVTAAALAPAEAAWRDDEAVLAPGAADELHTAADLRGALAAGVGMMYDYDDFNIMHSHAHLAAVFSQLPRALPGAGAEHAAACAWVAEATLRQSVQWPDGHFSQVSNGLFSGWRATTWANTVLNWAYFDCAAARAAQMGGARLLRRRHVGDDVYSVADSWLGAVCLYDALQAGGARAQPSKVLFSEEAAEFLRLRYDDSGVRGYAARTICGLVGGDPSGSENVDPASRALAVAEAVSRCAARGLREDVATPLMLRLVRYWGAAQPSAGGPLTPPPDAVLFCGRDTGGLGLYWDGAEAAKWVRVALPKRPPSAARVVRPGNIPTLATDDAVSRIAAVLPASWAPALARARQTFADASYAKPLGSAVHEVGRRRAAAELGAWYNECASVGHQRQAAHCTPGDVRAVGAAVERALRGTVPARPRLHGAAARIPGAAVALAEPVWRSPTGTRAIISCLRPELLADYDALWARAGGETAAGMAWGADAPAYGAVLALSPMVRDYASLVRSTLRATRRLVAPPAFCGDGRAADFIYATGLRSLVGATLPRLGVVAA